MPSTLARCHIVDVSRKSRIIKLRCLAASWGILILQIVSRIAYVVLFGRSATQMFRANVVI